MKQTSDKVIVINNGVKKEWDRQEAIKAYFEDLECCNGSELERSAIIYYQLCRGCSVCTDGE